VSRRAFKSATVAISRYWIRPGRNSRSSRWVRTDLQTRSWATDLSMGKYRTDPEKSYLWSVT